MKLLFAVLLVIAIPFSSPALRVVGHAPLLHSIFDNGQRGAAIQPPEYISVSFAPNDADPRHRRRGAPPQHKFLPGSPEAKHHSGLVLLITGGCLMVADAALILVSIKDAQDKKRLGYDDVYTADAWAFYSLPGQLGLSFAIPGIIRTIKYGKRGISQ